MHAEAGGDAGPFRPPEGIKMKKQTPCPDCRPSDLSRRDFVKAGSAAAVAASIATPALAAPKDKKKPAPAETFVAELYESLSDKQKSTICFDFDHQLRSKISANWHITKPVIDDDFYTDAQRDLIGKIVKGVTSEDGHKRLLKQMEEDDGGLGAYSIALFGKPGEKHQWVLTGRHLTLRADGNTTENMAFGGPIVYGHSEEEPKYNLFHYQTQQANKVFAALDEKQRQSALLKRAPNESQVPLQGKDARFPGVAVGSLSDDQKELVEQTVKVVLAPYREQDVKEVVDTLKKNGGLDQLHMAFYRQGDLEKDEVWDIWRMEGPGFVWHFRGAPHVHTYVNIGII